MARSKIFIMNAKSVRSLKNFVIRNSLDTDAPRAYYNMHVDTGAPGGMTYGEACQKFTEYLLHNLETHISHNCVGEQFNIGLPFALYIPHSVWKEIM